MGDCGERPTAQSVFSVPDILNPERSIGGPASDSWTIPVR